MQSALWEYGLCAAVKLDVSITARYLNGRLWGVVVDNSIGVLYFSPQCLQAI